MRGEGKEYSINHKWIVTMYIYIVTIVKQDIYTILV